MSDTPTLTVYEKCKHGRLEFHYFHDYDPDHVCDNPTHVECQKNVCGGREIELTGVRKKCFEPEWLTEDTMIYVVEVSDV